MIPVWAQLLYLFGAVCFILALKGLSGPKTARNGNLLGAFGAGSDPAVTVLGLRTCARSVERAHTLWSAVLQGHRADVDDVLVYRWPGSPMRITVETDPAADEGPVAIEFSSPRAVNLPETPHPALGASFRRSAP